MRYLNYELEELRTKGGIDTAMEISNQPILWHKTYLKLLKEKSQIGKFLDKVWKGGCAYIILTGAGTSAFIGESLVGIYQKKFGVPCRAIGTTEIATHPKNYFIKSIPTLLISFARSGDSPESIAAVELGRANCDNIFEINITCNKEGELARKALGENTYTFFMPEEANDKSLAMTSSFSSMLLAGLLISNIHEIEQLEPVVNKIRGLADFILDDKLSDLNHIATSDYDRVVFLGSGPFLGIAHESHLKVQEMTDGQVIGKFDTFLGFRHGPKAVVNNSTIVVYLFSNCSFSNLYEIDLVKAVKQTDAGEKTVAIGNVNNTRDSESFYDLLIQFPDGTEDIPEEFLSVVYILPAQIIGFYKSLSLGLSPDSPSKRGAISRVVEGVKIYDSILG